MPKKHFSKVFNSFDEAEKWDITYWNSQTPTTRLRVAEQLRRQLYGRTPKKLPRIFEITKRS